MLSNGIWEVWFLISLSLASFATSFGTATTTHQWARSGLPQTLPLYVSTAKPSQNMNSFSECSQISIEGKTFIENVTTSQI
jgi:hypothetical protein